MPFLRGVTATKAALIRASFGFLPSDPARSFLRPAALREQAMSADLMH
jgi:hypothetical protein